MKRDDVTLGEELGHGAFGKVFKGIMKVPPLKKKAKSTMTVAVKVLRGMLQSEQLICSHIYRPRATQQALTLSRL